MDFTIVEWMKRMQGKIEHFEPPRGSRASPGILAVRRKNDLTRDLTAKGIARAIRNLLGANVSIKDKLHLVKRWR